MRRLVLAALLLVSLPSFAATMYVTEFLGPPSVTVYYQAAPMPAVAQSTVAIAGASAQSAAFSSTTKLVRVHCDVICNITVGGTNPVATTSTLRLAAGQTEYFAVSPGDKVAVIAGT